MTNRLAKAPIAPGAHRTAPPRRSRAAWLAPTGLIMLSLIPVLGGAARLTEITGGATSTEHNARFLESPVPVVVHIVSVTVFCLVGALQFVPRLRVAGGRWHRMAGRILIPAGLLSAATGIWMVIFYPHPPGDGIALSVTRIVVGAAMIACIVLAIRAIVRREFADHGAWMTRAYAIGVGAGTQALVLIPGALIFGATHEASRAWLMGAAWAINLGIAEVIIRRRGRGVPRRRGGFHPARTQ